MTMKNSIIIFAGPTMSEKLGKTILPHALFLPPVQCGDIYSLLRMQTPSIIGIIDGYFDTIASIWHKEILYAIQCGVQVFGAGSMGALRACELEEFGMVGVGKIFDNYKLGEYFDDSDVAVVHGAKEFGYPVMTDALVNIKATVNKAQNDGIVGVKLAHEIIEQAKNTFFQKRKLNLVIAEMTSTTELENLKQWLAIEGNFVDQKALDAVQLLQLLNNDKQRRTPVDQKQLEPIWTYSAKFIFNYLSCRPNQNQASWLPRENKIASMSRLIGRKYFMVRKFAIAMNYVHSSFQETEATLEKNDGWFDKVTDGKDYMIWCEENDVSVPDEFKRRLSVIFGALNQVTDLNMKNLEHLARHYGYYPLSESKNEMLVLLHQLEGKLRADFESHNYKVPYNWSQLFSFSQTYFKELGLETQDDLNQWIEKNNLKESSDYNDFLKYILEFEIIVDAGSRLFSLPLKTHQTGIDWFLDALKITGVYSEIKNSVGQSRDFLAISLRNIGVQFPRINWTIERY